MYFETRVLSHRQRVCRLYKNALKMLRDYNEYYDKWRYDAVLLRHSFEKYRNLKDMIKAKQILAECEQFYERYKHDQPIIFPKDPGGVAEGRYAPIPDIVLDMWHPLEKMQYPHYFALREKRKEDYIKMYSEKYGNDIDIPTHH